MTILVGLVLLVLALAVVGFLVNMIVTRTPMDDSFKQVIILATVVIMVLLVLGIVVGAIPLPSFPFLKRVG